LICRLKEILDEKGLKQSYVCREAGISNTTMSKLVLGKSIPTLPVAYRIAKVLEKPIEEIWFEK